MALSEWEQYLERASNRRGAWPGEYADIDTYLIKNGIAADQVDWVRDNFYEKNVYDKRIYDKKSKSSNSDKEPQYSSPGGWLHFSNDACQHQAHSTIPQIIQTPRLSLGDRPPVIYSLP